MQLKMKRHAGVTRYGETWYEVVGPTGRRMGWVRKRKGTSQETHPWQAFRADTEVTGPDGGPVVGEFVGSWYGDRDARDDAMHAAAGAY